VVVPVAVVVLLALVCFIVVLVVLIKRRGNKSDDWEIEYSELEVGETLGAGGYGQTFSLSLFSLVFRACPPPRAGHDSLRGAPDQVGGRSYGEVHKAVWKGTEVAVKVIAAEKITKDMEKSFQDEVRVMTSLRHPNVVLFMAASTKPPKMCIVMEFMALGSLYDVRRPLPFAATP
jgi:serine/threonine protein kinase